MVASATVDRVADGYRRGVALVARRGPDPDATARVGLGVVILLAGTHKLVDPAAWTPYVVPWFDALLPVTPRTWFVVNGWLEIGFALPVIANRWVVPLSGFIAASLAATVGYLAVAYALHGAFAVALIRDVGLAALAVVVTVRAAREEAGRDGRDGCDGHDPRPARD